MNDLAILENVNAVEVFNGNQLDPLLDKITKEAKSIIPDLETKKGRDEIASMAHKVAKSKTYLDGLGKELVSDWKEKAKAVDSERKKMRDYLDRLKAEVRQPLTQWEEAEKNRVTTHQENIREMADAGVISLSQYLELPLEAMKDRLKEIESESIESYEEFAAEAAGVKDKAITDIKSAIEKREKYDAEQAELEQMRKEKAEREQKEREEQLRREGEERARREAEEKAQAEAKRMEAERQAAVKAQEDAEKRAKEAEDRAKKEIEESAQRERDRIEQERIAEEIAAKKREADKKHKAKINNAAVEGLVLSGMSEAQAKKAIIAIAKGKVPHVTISY